MPIYTNHRGVLVLVGCVAMLVWLFPSETAFAAPARSATVRNNGARTSATKGVRRNTAYQKRRSQTKWSYRYTTRARVSLPPESAAPPQAGEIIARAQEVVGTRYRWGGTSRATGFDCSGLVHYVYGDRARHLPRSSRGMYAAVSKSSEVRPGDLVFFGRGRRGIYHVGIYIGHGQIIHASTPRTGVQRASLATIARSLGFAGVGRII